MSKKNIFLVLFGVICGISSIYFIGVNKEQSFENKEVSLKDNTRVNSIEKAPLESSKISQNAYNVLFEKINSLKNSKSSEPQVFSKEIMVLSRSILESNLDSARKYHLNKALQKVASRKISSLSTTKIIDMDFDPNLHTVRPIFK